MLKNILTRTLIISCVLLFPSAALAGKTQIVVQWIDGANALSLFQVFKVQGVFDAHAMEYGYDSDGNDVGSRTQNFYLYADDRHVNAVVQSVIRMHKSNLLPDGMRIGVAIYKDTQRKDWTYKAVYPNTLRQFDIMYTHSN